MENKENMPENNPGFVQKFGLLVLMIGGVIILFTVMKLIFKI